MDAHGECRLVLGLQEKAILSYSSGLLLTDAHGTKETASNRLILADNITLLPGFTHTIVKLFFNQSFLKTYSSPL